MRLREICTGSTVVSSWPAQISLTVLRVFSGLSMALAHGWGKVPPSDRFVDGVEKMGFPLPVLFAYAAGFSEFFGGLLLAAGLLTRPSAFFILLTMLVAGFIRHADDPFSSIEKSLVYAAVMLVFVVMGGGKYSVDTLLQKRAGS